MADFTELKDKVLTTIGSMAGKTKDLAGQVADKTKDIAGQVADKAKDVSRIAKLTMEISGERETIRKAYVEIGKLYYETHKDDPEGFFVQLCDEITLATESIAAKEAEIAELKAAGAEEEAEADVDVEFENVVAQAEEDAPAADAPAEEAEAPDQEADAPAQEEESKE